MPAPVLTLYSLHIIFPVRVYFSGSPSQTGGNTPIFQEDYSHGVTLLCELSFITSYLCLSLSEGQVPHLIPHFRSSGLDCLPAVKSCSHLGEGVSIEMSPKDLSVAGLGCIFMIGD